MQKDKFCMPIPFCGAYILFRQTLEYKKNSKGVRDDIMLQKVEAIKSNRQRKQEIPENGKNSENWKYQLFFTSRFLCLPPI